jgi:hypothetical protein
MSPLGQKQTFAVHQPMSALSLKADMCDATSDVRFGPIADMPGLILTYSLFSPFLVMAVTAVVTYQ